MKSRLLVLCLALPLLAAAQWQNLTTITPTFYTRAVAWDGKAYFAGGLTSGTAVTNKIEIVDLSTGQKSTKTLSVARADIMCAAFAGKIYFAGGIKSGATPSSLQTFDVVDVLDVASGAITQATLSVPRSGGVAIIAGGKILFAGGATFTGGQFVNTDVVDIFDPATGIWSVQHLSEKKGAIGAAAFGNKAYFCGGLFNQQTGAASNRVEIYDAAAGVWETPDTLSVARARASVLAVGKFLVCAGGHNQTAGALDVVDILNTETGDWKTANLSEPRAFMAAVTLGKKGYFTGGGHVNYATQFLDASSATVDVFDAETELWDVSILNFNRMEHACVAWGNTVAVGGGWRPEQGQFTGVVEILTDSMVVSTKNPEAQPLQFSVSPCPASDFVQIVFPEKTPISQVSDLLVSDFLGRVLLRKNAFLEFFASGFDISGLPNGFYQVSILSDGRKIGSSRLLVKH